MDSTRYFFAESYCCCRWYWVPIPLRKGGRPPFPYKENVKQAVEKILKRNPNITKGKIPFMPEVVNTFSPKKGESAYPNMPAKEYK